MNQPAPLNLPHAPAGRTSQATEVEKSRATAEVYAAVLAAKQVPRSEDYALAAMRRACESPWLAERAFFRLPRGEEIVTGESIHLARELARCWGNVQYGVTELRRDEVAGESELQAWAWDLESNNRPSHTFIVPHRRDLRGGRTRALTTVQDVYENNANAGARRVREQIFAVLPVWFVEEAKERCRAALEKGDGKPLGQRITDALHAFGQLGVTEDQLTTKLGKPRGEWDEQDVANLSVIYSSIRSGQMNKDTEFPPAAAEQRVTAAELTAPGPAPSEAIEPERAAEENTGGHAGDSGSKASVARTRKMHALFREADITDRDQRLDLTGKILGREITTSAGLTNTDANTIIDKLEEWAKDGHLADHVAAMLHGGDGQ